MVLKRWGRGCKPRPASGFTLIEMILVLVIAGLLLAAVGPRIAAGIGGVEFHAATREIASALRAVRAKAVAERREAALTVYIAEHAYDVDAEKRYDIPEDVEVSVYTASEQVFGGDSGAIVFYPDGSASGGRITLEYRGRKRSIDINWLTGMVEILEQPQ
jgi:general secretion pathway protein H